MKRFNVVRHESPKKDVFRVYSNPLYSGFSSKGTRHKKYNSIENRQKSNLRAKRRIQELININFSDKFTFITLTFRENLENPEISNNTFGSFIKRLKYYLKQKISLDFQLKYISILETQKRGSIHYHIVCNLPSQTDFKDIIRLWQKSIDKNENIKRKGGSVKIRYSYESDLNTEDLSLYLTKYLTKTFNNSKFCGKKIYSASRNLKKPKRKDYMINFNKKKLNHDEIIQILNKYFQLNPQNIVQKNKYLNPYSGEDVYYFEVIKKI